MERRRAEQGATKSLSRMRARLARLSQGPDRDADALDLNNKRLFSVVETRKARAIARVLTKGNVKMLRPDHIYFAMTMVKHSTLAGAFIFAFKILRFAAQSF